MREDDICVVFAERRSQSRQCLPLSVGVHIGCVVCCEQRRLETEERQYLKTESLRLGKACVIGQSGIALDPPDGDGSSQQYPL